MKEKEQLERYKEGLERAEELRKYIPSGINRIEEITCINCGSKYNAFFEMPRTDDYLSDSEELNPNCPKCFYDHNLNEDSIRKILEEYTRMVITRKRTEVDSEEAAKKVLEEILLYWPKN
jgi:hypothetical protein